MRVRTCVKMSENDCYRLIGNKAALIRKGHDLTTVEAGTILTEKLTPLETMTSSMLTSSLMIDVCGMIVSPMTARTVEWAIPRLSRTPPNGDGYPNQQSYIHRHSASSTCMVLESSHPYF